MKLILKGTPTDKLYHLTIGKEYLVEQYDPKNKGICAGAWIEDDGGELIYVLIHTPGVCAHLAGTDAYFKEVDNFEPV